MDLQELRVFVAIAECAGATHAARTLGMTQPGVSQYLARLEQAVGRQLFDRHGKRLELNDFGRMFLGRAKKLLLEAAELEGLADGSIVPTGALTLGLTDSSTLTIIPEALKAFRERYPNIHVRMDVDDSGDIEDGVVRGHFDLGVVTAGPRTHPLVDEEALYEDRIDALVCRTHPLAKRRRLTLEQLVEWPLLVYPRRSRTRLVIDEGFREHQLFPRELIEVYFNTAAVRLAEIGVGVALLSQAFITGEVPKHRCAHLRLTGDPFTRTIAVARKRGKEMSEATACFYEMLKECARSQKKG